MTNKPSLPKLFEAGPGAGKTHSMVDEIVSAIQVLPPHRFLAAVTYTNAAAYTIRDRLSRQIQLRNNVFVGTVHSFVNRFVLSPCAQLLSLLPEDRIYAAIDPYEKGRGAAIYTKNLIGKGIVPYDAMVPLAREILERSEIRERVCGRLSYVFVDEFQDADIGMLDIFEQFRRAGRTALYLVGDPEQYVMSFSYRGRRPPQFDKIPFFRFQKLAECKEIVKNHRSNEEIVTFANQFRGSLRQKAVKPRRAEDRVLFIPTAFLEAIVRRFQSLSDSVETEEAHRTRLYISEENATFHPVCDQFGLMPASNASRKTNTLLGDALDLLSLALDRSQRKACETCGMSRLQWRGEGVRLLKDIKAGHDNFEHLAAFVAEAFGHKVKSRSKSIEEALATISERLRKTESIPKSDLYSSIRKAKGLEADAVLVVAKSVAELKKWLQTERSCRVADGQDKCRLGYVAFTRPREMLCIACLQKLDEEACTILDRLGVTMAPEET
jgi:DNA helicase II / ATP-dependent DNA helicase PcrA